MKLGTLLVTKGVKNYVNRAEIKVGTEISISAVKEQDDEMISVGDYFIESEAELSKVNAEILELRKVNSMVYVSINA